MSHVACALCGFDGPACFVNNDLENPGERLWKRWSGDQYTQIFHLHGSTVNFKVQKSGRFEVEWPKNDGTEN